MNTLSVLIFAVQNFRGGRNFAVFNFAVKKRDFRGDLISRSVMSFLLKKYVKNQQIMGEYRLFREFEVELDNSIQMTEK